IRPSLTSLLSHHGDDVRQIDGNRGGLIEHNVKWHLDTVTCSHEACRCLKIGASCWLTRRLVACRAEARADTARAFAFRPRRGSLHSLRERRLVEAKRASQYVRPAKCGGEL